MNKEIIERISQVLINLSDEDGIIIITSALEQAKQIAMEREKQIILDENQFRIIESQVPIQNAIDYIIGETNG